MLSVCLQHRLGFWTSIEKWTEEESDVELSLGGGWGVGDKREQNKTRRSLSAVVVHPTDTMSTVLSEQSVVLNFFTLLARLVGVNVSPETTRLKKNNNSNSTESDHCSSSNTGCRLVLEDVIAKEQSCIQSTKY